MLKRIVAFLAIGFAVASCDVSGLVPTEHLEFAKRVVSLIQARQWGALQQITHPLLWEKLPQDLRERMADLLPANEQPADISVSNWKTNVNNNVSNTHIEMMYKYARETVQVTEEFQSAGTGYVLTMIYLKPVSGVVPAPQNSPAPAPAPQAAPQEQPMPQPDAQQPDDQQPGDQDQQQDDKSNSL